MAMESVLVTSNIPIAGPPLVHMVSERVDFKNMHVTGGQTISGTASGIGSDILSNFRFKRRILLMTKFLRSYSSDPNLVIKPSFFTS